MNCDQVRERIDAYALDALDDTERLEVEEHLASCALHDEAVSARAVASALVLAPASDVDLPAGMEARLHDRLVRATPARAASTAAWHSARAAYAAAAVLAIAVVALAAWNVMLATGSDDEGGHTHTLTYTDGEGHGLRMVRAEGEREFEIAFRGLPQRPPHETYELWVIRGDAWLSVGRFNTGEDATWEGRFAFDFFEGDVLCVTVQSAADEQEPFGAPLIWAPL